MNLVTGATGHIGNVLTRILLEKGEKVRALVLPGEDLTPLEGLNVEITEGDVLDPASLKEAFQGVQDVYHLAGVISIMPGKNDLLRRVNVQGTHNVLEAARHAKIRRLVYTSSIHAITRIPHGATIDENIPFDPEHAISEYDRSKAEASLAVQQAAREGMDAVIVCPTGVIGPYDYRHSEMGSLILDCSQNPMQFWIDGAYDFVDVRDVAQGIILANEKGRSGESYILSGEQISVHSLMKTIREITGLKSIHIRVPISLAHFAARFTPLYYRLANIRPRFTHYALETVASNSVISNAKARKELGYQPRSLRESLADTVRWFQENRQHLSTTTTGT
jgi:nucleoside-diphosphate-sugar epimerase